MSDLLNLSGRTVFISGASGGIGGAIARTLVQAGAKCVLHYQNNKQAAQNLADVLGGECVQADLSREAEVERMFETLTEREIYPDLLVNNAGIFPMGTIVDAPDTLWKQMNAVNLEGVYALTKHFAKSVISQGAEGAIVNIGSIAGLDPAQGHSHYAASKAALLSYTRASAAELGAHNIRVNAVSPGLIYREGLDTDWPEGVEAWHKHAPLTRVGQGEDVANAVLFLLSSSASWISGSNLVVDGGMSAHNRW